MKILSLFAALLIFTSAAAAEKKSLYDRLGKKEALTKVVDQFVANVLADPTIQPFFAITANEGDRAVKLKKHLVDQICQATGGPCKYTGRDMVTAHKDMQITDQHFDALVKALVAALDQFKVPAGEQEELLAILSPMRVSIVQKNLDEKK